MESFVDMDGTVVSVHEEGSCTTHAGLQARDIGCPIHAPSNHEFVELPLRWSRELAMFLRVDKDGNEFIDPDSEAYALATQTLNKARCLKCGQTLVSQHRHDYKTCRCGNLSVDGGPAYIKRGFRDGEDSFEELSTGPRT